MPRRSTGPAAARSRVILAALRSQQLSQPAALTAAYAATARALIAVITALNEQIAVLEDQRIAGVGKSDTGGVPGAAR